MEEEEDDSICFGGASNDDLDNTTGACVWGLCGWLLVAIVAL